MKKLKKPIFSPLNRRNLFLQQCVNILFIFFEGEEIHKF